MLHECCVWQSTLGLFFSAGNVYCLFRTEHSIFLPLLIEKKLFWAGCQDNGQVSALDSDAKCTLRNLGHTDCHRPIPLKCKDRDFEQLTPRDGSTHCLALLVCQQSDESSHVANMDFLFPPRFIPFSNFQLLFESRL